MAQHKPRQSTVKPKGTKTKPRAVKETRAVYAVASPKVTQTDHPHVIKVEGVRGGDPILRESYVSVRAVVEITYRLKQTPEEIVDSYNDMTLAQVFDALSYYHDHKQEVDDIIEANDRAGERAQQISRQYAERDRLNRLAKEKSVAANGG
jgi:uncharacterized protein (DUF433 family)